MDYLEKAKRVFEIEIRELQRLRERLGEDFSRAVGLIKDAVDARGKVVVVGVGKSGHIGGKIASTLTSTGSPAVVLDSLILPIESLVAILPVNETGRWLIIRTRKFSGRSIVVGVKR